MGMVNSRVLHKYPYLLACQLLTIIPHYRITVHIHAGIERRIDQRVAHGLHITTIGSHLIIGMYLAIDRIGTDIKCKNLKGVGMHIQRILLGEVVSHRTISSHCIACGVVVFRIVARQLVLVDRVGIDHIIICMIQTGLGIMIDTITNQRLTTILHHRTTKEFRLFSLSVIVAILTIDMAATRCDIRRTDDMSTGRAGVIVKRVGSEI